MLKLELLTRTQATCFPFLKISQYILFLEFIEGQHNRNMLKVGVIFLNTPNLGLKSSSLTLSQHQFRIMSFKQALTTLCLYCTLVL